MDTESLIRKNQLLEQEVQRQTQEVRRRIDHMAAINNVAATVSKSLDLDTTLETALSAVTAVIGAEAAGISLIDDDAQEVVLRAQLGWEQDFVHDKPMRIPLGKGMSGQVIASDDILVENNLENRTGFAVPRFGEEAFRSIAMAPMHARGRIIGILSLMSSKAYSFSEEVLYFLRAVADTVGVAVENARLYEESVENENRLSAVLRSTADGIIATSQDGRISLMNPAAETMLSVRADDVVGRPLRKAPIPAQIREHLTLALASRAESPEKSFQVKLENGRILLLVVSTVEAEQPLMNGHSGQDGWVVVLQDVTHLREAEKMRTEFIQAAAHDMRNPLGVTTTSLGTLRTILDTINNDLAYEVLEIAESGVHRLQKLIDDLLNLERIESGYIFEMEPVDIIELLYGVSAECKALADGKNQTCTLDIEPGIPIMDIDAHWIGRALYNYMGNAVKYTQVGGHIVMQAFSKEQMLHIEVSDNGPGIPADAQSRLFERFYRARDTSAERGSGLGLAIVKSIVEAHGGSVYMRSRVGAGSTFGFTLPL